jgi:hypothetical protein
MSGFRRLRAHHFPSLGCRIPTDADSKAILELVTIRRPGKRAPALEERFPQRMLCMINSDDPNLPMDTAR